MGRIRWYFISVFPLGSITELTKTFSHVQAWAIADLTGKVSGLRKQAVGGWGTVLELS